MKKFTPLAFITIATAALLAQSSSAETQNARPENASVPSQSVFAMPAKFPKHRELLTHFYVAAKSENYAAMEKVTRAATKLFPEDATWRYNLACATARLGQLTQSLKILGEAVDLGFVNSKQLAADNDLAQLRRNSEFADILKRARDLERNPEKLPTWRKATLIGTKALVSEENTLWDMQNGGFITKFSTPEQVMAPSREFVSIPGETGAALRKWQQEGRAAGNVGDLYDNRDRGHATLQLTNFPGMIPIVYSQEAKDHFADTGVSSFRFGGIPVIGNSSTAVAEGPFWRSNARRAILELPHTLLAQYMSNQIYVYPQHHDYLPALHGDVFPARTPYAVIAPGSSWTDLPILAAMASAMAAFTPETKSVIVKKHLLAPTMQYLLRSCSTAVSEREDYLTAKAHPVVFKGSEINTLKLVTMAHDMTAEAIPPIAAFYQESKDPPMLPMRDFFDNAPGETLLALPHSLAKVWRGMDYTRSVTLNATVSTDSQERALKYHWFIGQGDPERIRIVSLEKDASRVNVQIDYHETPFDTPFGIESSRVDIILVVDNGVSFSPPAFFSYFFLVNEKRTYFSDKRIFSVDYASCATNYVDPQVSLPKAWRDIYTYDDSGKSTGWIRTSDGGKTARFELDNGKISIKSNSPEQQDGGEKTTGRYRTVSPARNFDGDLELISEEIDGN